MVVQTSWYLISAHLDWTRQPDDSKPLFQPKFQIKRVNKIHNCEQNAPSRVARWSVPVQQLESGTFHPAPRGTLGISHPVASCDFSGVQFSLRKPLLRPPAKVGLLRRRRSCVVPLWECTAAEGRSSCMVQERRRRRGVSWRCGKWIQFLNGGKNVPLMEVQNPNCYISALSYCSNNSDGWQLLHWRQQTREPCRHDIITTLVRWKRVAGVLSFLGFFFSCWAQLCVQCFRCHSFVWGETSVYLLKWFDFCFLLCGTRHCRRQISCLRSDKSVAVIYSNRFCFSCFPAVASKAPAVRSRCLQAFWCCKVVFFYCTREHKAKETRQ